MPDFVTVAKKVLKWMKEYRPAFDTKTLEGMIKTVENSGPNPEYHGPYHDPFPTPQQEKALRNIIKGWNVPYKY